MIELDNRTSIDVNIALSHKIALLLTNREIELIIVSKDEMQEINFTQRNINNSTDVLSFPYEKMPMSPLGSIVISAWHIESVAKELKHTNTQEFTILFLHGLLHLLGFDHEVDNGEMRAKEVQIIDLFKLPNSLITRT